MEMTGKWIGPGSNRPNDCQEPRLIVAQDTATATAVNVFNMKTSTIRLSTFKSHRTKYSINEVTEASVREWHERWCADGAMWNGALLTPPRLPSWEMRRRFPGLLTALADYAHIWTPSVPAPLELAPAEPDPPKKPRADQALTALQEANRLASEQTKELRQIRGMLGTLIGLLTPKTSPAREPATKSNGASTRRQAGELFV